MQEADKRRHHGQFIVNMVLVGAALGSLSLLAYFFYNYTWTGRQQFSGWDGPVLYYGVTAMAAALFMLSLKLRHDLKVNFAILSCSTFVSFYGGEAYITLLGVPRAHTESLWDIDHAQSNRRDEVFQLAKSQGVEFDFRTKIEALIDLRNSGIDAVPSLSILLTPDSTNVNSLIQIRGEEVLPLAGISNRTTLFCNETGQYAVYTSDEHGFNSPPDIWSVGKTDIVALGDSFTHGACVAPDKNFVALLRQTYPMTINAAYLGSGPLTMLGTLTEALAVTQPNVVLWFYAEPDLLDFSKELESPLLVRYLEEGFSQKLLFRQEEIDQTLTTYVQEQFTKEKSAPEVKDTFKEISVRLQGILRLRFLRQHFGLIKGIDQSLPEGGMEEHLKRFQRVLLRAKDLTARSGGQLYFVHLPAWERYGDPARAYPERDRVLSLVKSMDVPVIDIHQTFQLDPDPLSLFPLRRFGHYNEKGHRLVAQTVLEHLQRDGKFRRHNPVTKLTETGNQSSALVEPPGRSANTASGGCPECSESHP